MICKSMTTPIAAYIFYSALIFGYWLALGVDYTNMTDRNVVFVDLVVPLTLGAAFLVVVITRLGWWRDVMVEDPRGRPRWAMWPIIIAMSLFISINLATTDWAAIGAFHLTMLGLAALLVGFNEEALYRGLIVVGLRKSGATEIKVWFTSSLLFALMHLPNGFFGTGMAGAITQAFSVFLAAAGYLVLRRVGGTLLLPMLFHASWDLSIFAQGASGAPSALLVNLVLDDFVGVLSILLIIPVMRAAKVPL